MAPRFHVISAELLLDSIHIDAPTKDDCKKFKKPDLSSKHEHELCRELVVVVQSVLNAAGSDSDGLCFFDSAKDTKKGCRANARKPAFNDGGIYLDSPLVRKTTEFTSRTYDRSEITTGQMGFCSRDWPDIPFRVQMSKRRATSFYCEHNSRRYKDIRQPSTFSADPMSTTGQVGDIVELSSGRQTRVVDVGVGVETSFVAGGWHGTDLTAKPSMNPPAVPPFVKLSERVVETLGQFIEDILDAQKNQHRVFSYAICICYDTAHLVYFDRSGVTVSEPFRWDEPDSILHQFVWKIAKLVKDGRFAELGHDETASLAPDEEKDKFLALKDDMSLLQHVRDGFKNATADKWPIYKLEVTPGAPSEDEWFSDMTFPPPEEFSSSSTGQPQLSSSESTHPTKPSSPSDPPKPDVRYFLVGKPHFAADGLVGRCTRGYLAYDVTDADEKNWRVCFLKDSWRPVVPGRTRPEHLVYQRLRFHGVNRGIGTLICGGDVGGHRAQGTRTQNYLSNKNAVLRVHYRLVIAEIGIRLEEFSSFPELSAIFMDAISAHHKAWSLAKVLHGDISVGNIMILPATAHSPRRTGLLIDWDLCRLESELGTGRVEPGRMGTWQFRSALWLAMPWKPYRCTDDVESFIHVYFYLVLRFHATSVLSLQELVRTYFDGVSLVHGIKVGGDRKLAQLTSSRLWFEVESNPGLQDLLDNIFFECSRSYDVLDLPEMHRRHGFPEPAPQPVSETPDPLGTSTVSHLPKRNNRLPRSKMLVSPSTNEPSPDPTPCADPDEDLSIVGGILSNVGDLVDLFRAHAMHPRLDKACDQFLARQHRDVYRYPSTAGNRSFDSLSTSGTSRSSGQQESTNVSNSVPLNPSSHPGPNISDSSMPGTSLNSKKRVRVASGPPINGTTASDEQGLLDLEHRNKRVK